jgi:hypothetical protein
VCQLLSNRGFEFAIISARSAEAQLVMAFRSGTAVWEDKAKLSFCEAKHQADIAGYGFFFGGRYFFSMEATIT